MSHALVQEAHAAFVASALSPSARFVFYLLAEAAPREPPTRLAWLSHETLAERAGYTVRGVSKAVAALEDEGWVSAWRRPGRSALYLLHPHGAAALLPPKRTEMFEHLERGHFSAAEREEAWQWRAALAGSCQPNVISLSPGTQFRGDHRGSEHSSPRPGTQFRPAPELSSTESELNRKGTGRPDLRLAMKGEPAEDRGSEAASTAPLPPPATKTDWSKPLSDIVADKRGQHGREGERWRELSDDEALRQAEKLQGTMQRHKVAAE